MHVVLTMWISDHWFATPGTCYPPPLFSFTKRNLVKRLYIYIYIYTYIKEKQERKKKCIDVSYKKNSNVPQAQSKNFLFGDGPNKVIRIAGKASCSIIRSLSSSILLTSILIWVPTMKTPPTDSSDSGSAWSI